MPLTVVAILLIGSVIIVYLIYRFIKQKNTAQATIQTPGYTENKVDDQFVFLTFRPNDQQPITIEYYFDKNIYKTPQDFKRLHKTVTVKYDPAQPTNYTVYEQAKGDYTNIIASALIAVVFATLIAQTADEPMANKVKTFVIALVIIFIVVLIVIKLNAYFSFLNILFKQKED